MYAHTHENHVACLRMHVSDWGMPLSNAKITFAFALMSMYRVMLHTISVYRVMLHVIALMNLCAWYAAYTCKSAVVRPTVVLLD